MKQKAKTIKRVSVKEFLDKYNNVLNRRGHPMRFSYLYRLIREDIAGTCTRKLWFDYELEEPADRIWILVED